ncbi:hypothetical protein [Tepidiforma bonchosmolovskayae]|uniref:Phage tail protein n=1 Tax=Tepidiforma bonchosmolovskayae TaxID=2601677 RepID=A0ABX6BZ38_9CHLR|nr:hypothetical protein [Tepidiforma bonchosmolovskayae]QFG02167.1 hypothetical protein Tbon_02260 [Tepidiforma bonchosmolovskayae]
MRPWRITRFEDRWDPTIGWNIPEADYEWQAQSGIRVAATQAVGRDYAVDLLGWARAPRSDAVETVRCALVAPDPQASIAQWMDIQRTLERIGRGKLWAELPDGSRLWCEARLRQAPNYTVSAYSWLRQAVSVQWQRLSPWWSETALQSQWTVISSGQQQTVTIGGTSPTGRVTIRLVAGTVGGYANPRIVDMAGGATIQCSRTAAVSGAILELDAWAQTARESTDGGTTWTDVSSSVSLPAWQVPWFELRPGVATIRYEQDSGSPSVTVTLTWVDAYAG